MKSDVEAVKRSHSMTSRRPGSLASGWGTGTSALGRFAHGCARALSMTGVLAPFILPMPLQGATKVELPLTSKWGQEPPIQCQLPEPWGVGRFDLRGPGGDGHGAGDVLLALAKHGRRFRQQEL